MTFPVSEDHEIASFFKPWGGSFGVLLFLNTFSHVFPTRPSPRTAGRGP